MAIGINIACKCLTIIDKINDAVSIAKENDEECSFIFRTMRTLKDILKDYTNCSIPENMKSALNNVYDELRSSSEVLYSILDQGPMKRLLTSKATARSLQKLVTHINTAISLLHCAQGSRGREEDSPDEEINNKIPSRPTDIKVTKKRMDRIKLSWKVPEENADAVDHYEVHYRRRFKTWAQPIQTNNTHIVVKDLTAGKSYWFFVYAVTRDGNACASEEIHCLTTEKKQKRYIKIALAGIAGFGSIPYQNAALCYTQRSRRTSKMKLFFSVTATFLSSFLSSPKKNIIVAATNKRCLLAPDDFENDE